MSQHESSKRPNDLRRNLLRDDTRRRHLSNRQELPHSVEMIETYYASHLKYTLDAAAINVRKSKVKSIRHDEE